MSIGAFRHLVQLQRPDSGRDAIGQPVLTWSTVDSVYADIRFLSSRRSLEAMLAGALTSTPQVSIRIRGFRSDLTTDMRVLHEGVMYSILAVAPDMQRRRFVDLQCEIAK